MQIGVVDILIIDRFEGDWVVVEYKGEAFQMPRVLFPPQVKEGDLVRATMVVDDQATQDRRKRVEKLADELFED